MEVIFREEVIEAEDNFAMSTSDERSVLTSVLTTLVWKVAGEAVLVWSGKPPDVLLLLLLHVAAHAPRVPYEVHKPIRRELVVDEGLELEDVVPLIEQDGQEVCLDGSS